MEPLSEAQIEQELHGTGWRHVGNAIVSERTVEDFGAAMAFANRVATAAEAADHHPDILIHGYNRVRLTLSTHSAGGVTARDLELARTIDAGSA